MKSEEVVRMKNTKRKLGTVKVCLERSSVNALLAMLDTMMIAGDETEFGKMHRHLTAVRQRNILIDKKSSCFKLIPAQHDLSIHYARVGADEGDIQLTAAENGEEFFIALSVNEHLDIGIVVVGDFLAMR